MEYDLSNVFGDWVDDLLTLTYNQSCFIKAQWPGHNITFLDTLRHWPMSVEKMGNYINLPKLTAAGTGNRFDDVDYCKRDTEIVWRFVDAMTEKYHAIGARVKNTLPSSAFELFKTHFCDIPLQRPNDETCEKLMTSAYGGRVEIFKTGLLDGPIDCYDVNSLYPSVMFKEIYPAPTSGRFVTGFRPERESITNATVEVGNDYIPPLPFRHDGKLIFPTGEFTGTWAAPELRAALDGGAKIKRINWNYEYSETVRPFQKWVDFIYKQRLKATDELSKYSMKIFLNSVFGKFTEAGALQIYKKKKRTDLKNRPEYSNIALGVYTTCYGRLRLMGEMRRHEKEICYCDTDSVFLKNSPPLPTGPNLGEWKHEGRFSRAEFILPKFYMTVDDNGKTNRKAKGIPKKAIEDFFIRGVAEYDSPIRFRESRRRGLTANEWHKKTRALRASYSKRETFASGETLPIKMTGGRQA